MYLKEKQNKIAMILLCPVQGPWASSLFFTNSDIALLVKPLNMILPHIYVFINLFISYLFNYSFIFIIDLFVYYLFIISNIFLIVFRLNQVSIYLTRYLNRVSYQNKYPDSRQQMMTFSLWQTYRSMCMLQLQMHITLHDHFSHG